ncbi:MAG TPA: hypothetical protein VFR11_23015 [Micromonosporaceae bacterium]|jgi:hypothetical protein|nr:hypothetical protein [Micromonosporaceae bacterium]
MSGLVWAEDEHYRWAIAEAPLHIEMSISELCGANNAAIHAEGRHLVIDNVVWYRPIAFDPAAGLLEFVKDRDDRPGRHAVVSEGGLVA